MRKLIVALTLTIALSGCASLQNLQRVYQQVSTATVTPQQVYIIANTFDAIQATATQYLIYCKAHLAEQVCSATNRRTVIRGVRAGRAARNQLEVYLTQSANAPAQIYNTLVAVITNLQQSAATQVGAAQ